MARDVLLKYFPVMPTASFFAEDRELQTCIQGTIKSTAPKYLENVLLGNSLSTSTSWTISQLAYSGAASEAGTGVVKDGSPLQHDADRKCGEV